MDAVSHTTHSNAFSWMKMLEFWLRFHWSLFVRVQLTIIQHWFRWWLGAGQATSHYLNQWWLVYWRKYASLGLNELKHTTYNMSITDAGLDEIMCLQIILHTSPFEQPWNVFCELSGQAWSCYKEVYQCMHYWIENLIICLGSIYVLEDMGDMVSIPYTMCVWFIGDLLFTTFHALLAHQKETHH